MDSDNEEGAPLEPDEPSHDEEIDEPLIMRPEEEFIEKYERECEAIAAARSPHTQETCSTSPATSTSCPASPGAACSDSGRKRRSAHTAAADGAAEAAAASVEAQSPVTGTVLPSPTTVPAAKFPLGEVSPPPKAPSGPRRPGASARAKAPCACCPRRASPTPSLLQAMTDVVNDQAMSCNVIDVVYPEGAELLSSAVETPRHIALKVVLDSGAGAHVVNKKAVPGYAVRASAMSRAGAAFFAADGGRIKNYGEVQVNMASLDSQGNQHLITSKFEAADVTRALWSVGVICDSGLDVRFSATRAWVLDEQGQELCVFHRTAGSGLYIAEVMVENPDHPDFQRRGA